MLEVNQWNFAEFVENCIHNVCNVVNTTHRDNFRPKFLLILSVLINVYVENILYYKSGYVPFKLESIIPGVLLLLFYSLNVI